MIDAYIEIFGKFQPNYHIADCHSLEEGYEAARKFLNLPKRPTAIYANGDEVAGGIYLYARSLRLEIPTDLAIIGQENQPIGIGMGISTVDHQLTKVGEQACSLVIKKSREKVKIPYRIVKRNSV